MDFLRKIVSRFVVGIVSLYRNLISPFLGPRCRFYPSCSAYMIEAVKMNGPIVGLSQGLMRLMKCNPLFQGGVDYPKKVKRC